MVTLNQNDKNEENDNPEENFEKPEDKISDHIKETDNTPKDNENKNLIQKIEDLEEENMLLKNEVEISK